MANILAGGRLLLPLFLLGSTSLSAGAGQPASAETAVTSLKLTPVQTTRVALSQERLILPAPHGQRVVVKVVLERIRCTYEMTRLTGGTPERQTGEITLYQLRSTDPSRQHVWTYVNTSVVHGFQLFSEGPGKNYFTWLAPGHVFVSEVSQPRDRHTAVTEFLSAKASSATVHFPLRDLLPSRDLGVDAVKDAVCIVFAGKSGTNWVIRLMSQVSGKVYTIVGDGKKWHTESPATPQCESE